MTRIVVGATRVDVVVALVERDAGRPVVDARAAERALVLLPRLAEHRCLNECRQPFADEIVGTEVAHLFEHVVLELMALAGSPRSLRGETSWDVRHYGRGIFRVSLEYDDDVVCLGAIDAAGRLMPHILDGDDRPDVDSEVRRLVGIRDAAGSR